MKRILSLALVLTLVLSMGLISAKAEGTQKIIWWVYGDAPIDVKMVVEAANKYSAEKIGVEVDLIFKTDEQFATDMGSDTYYDMTFTCDWANSFVDNVVDERFYDITDLVKTATPAL